MALIQVNHLSKVLVRTVPVNVILPSDKIGFETLDHQGVPPTAIRRPVCSMAFWATTSTG